MSVTTVLSVYELWPILLLDCDYQDYTKLMLIITQKDYIYYLFLYYRVQQKFEE